MSQRSRLSPLAGPSYEKATLNTRKYANVPPWDPKGKRKEEELDGLPLDIQEALILEDLLYILIGLEGTYITYDRDCYPRDERVSEALHFRISPGLDIALSKLVERVLPLGTYYYTISAFVGKRSHLQYGLVNHALCASIRGMLKDYLMLIMQLERAYNSSPQFTLMKLWFYVHPTVHTLYLIHELVVALDRRRVQPDSSSLDSKSDFDPADLGEGDETRGGEVLAILYEKLQSMSGDETARNVYEALYRAAEVPYVAMIDLWVTTGQLVDPYGELFVKEDKHVDRNLLNMVNTDDYWEDKYAIRDGLTVSMDAPVDIAITKGRSSIASPLEPWKHKILLVGKYINVLRECGVEVSLKCLSPVSCSSLDDQFFLSVEKAYSQANHALLHFLVKDRQLLRHLRAFRRYFLLSHSSYLSDFLDLSRTELRKPVQSVSITRLQSVLELTLASDAGDDDAVDRSVRDRITVSMSSSGLYEWLLSITNVTGLSEPQGEGKKPKDKEKNSTKLAAIDALTLYCHIPFPLSLVLSGKNILRYQLLFRFLLHLRHVEQSLTSMWAEHKSASWKQHLPLQPAVAQWRLRVALLRSRMLAFVQQVSSFATCEVLEPNWRVLEDKIERVETVDQLLSVHVDFLDTSLKGCMLTSAKLLKAHSKLMTTCSTFALYASAFNNHVNQAINTGGDGMADRWSFLSKFETHFNHWFNLYLNYLQMHASSENTALLPLIVRLNNIQVLTRNE